MSARLLPATAAGLALLWCLAQGLDSPLLAASVAVLAIWAAALTALRRRASQRFGIALAALMLLVGGALLVFVVAPLSGARGFLLQIAFLLVLAPLFPLVYAATFQDRPKP